MLFGLELATEIANSFSCFFRSMLSHFFRPLLFIKQVRYLIYSKDLESQIDIVHPQELGGLKSEAYLSLNPQGKMPLLVLPSGEAFPESDTISRFILDEFRSSGPTFDPGSSLLRAKSDLAARILDIYITPNQVRMRRMMRKRQKRPFFSSWFLKKKKDSSPPPSKTPNAQLSRVLSTRQ